MSTKSTISEFMSQKSLALVRASATAKVSGFAIDKELGAKGYSVTVVYLDDANCATKLRDLASSIGGVIVAVPSDKSEAAIQNILDAKIKRIWIQKGCESKSAIDLCTLSGVSAIHGQCIMMFAEPVKSVHRFHRWIMKIAGRLPN